MPVKYNTGGMAIAGLLHGVLTAQLRKRQFKMQDEDQAMKERTVSLQERTQKESQSRLRQQMESEQSFRTGELQRRDIGEGKQEIAGPILEGLRRDMEGLQQKLQQKGVTVPEVSKMQARLEEIAAKGEQERETLHTKAGLGLGPKAAQPPTTMTPIETQKKLRTQLKGADVVEGESLTDLEQYFPNITARMAKLISDSTDPSTGNPTLSPEDAKDMVKAEDYMGRLEQDELIGPEIKGRGNVPLFDPEAVNDLVASIAPSQGELFDTEGLFASFDDVVLTLTESGWEEQEIRRVIEELLKSRDERLYESKVQAGTVVPAEEQAFTNPSGTARNIP